MSMSMSEEPRPQKASADKAELAAQALSGVTSTGAGLLLDPTAAVIASAAAPFVEASLIPILKGLGSWTEELSRRFLKRTGRGPEDLRDLLENHPQASALLVDGAWACARADSELKIETIGRVITEGLLYEDDVEFDVEAHVARVICQLDKNHVAVLAVVGRHPSGSEVSLLCEFLPQLSVIVPSLVNELSHLGLLDQLIMPPTAGGPGRLHGPGGSPEPRRGSASDSNPSVPMQACRISSLGTRVLREFATSAITIDQPLNLGISPLELPENCREYLGMVIPPPPGWRSPTMSPSNRSRRTVWIETDRTCAICGTGLVARATSTLSMGDSASVQILPVAPSCPQGPVHVDSRA
ncbi:Uncharacterised protein [Micrococcus luteus]|nr:Uncharacterised protein [Micrococcus luteus]